MYDKRTDADLSSERAKSHAKRARELGRFNMKRAKALKLSREELRAAVDDYFRYRDEDGEPLFTC